MQTWLNPLTPTEAAVPLQPTPRKEALFKNVLKYCLFFIISWKQRARPTYFMQIKAFEGLCLLT